MSSPKNISDIEKLEQRIVELEGLTCCVAGHHNFSSCGWTLEHDDRHVSYLTNTCRICGAFRRVKIPGRLYKKLRQAVGC